MCVFLYDGMERAHSWPDSAGASHKVTKRPCVRAAPSAILTSSAGTTVPYRTVHKTSAPLLPPVAEQSLSGFPDPIGFEGRAGGRVELPWDYPSLGFWLGLRQNPGELSSLVCVCLCEWVVYVLGRASMVLYICHFLPRETARKVSLVFTSIRTLEEFILINWNWRGCAVKSPFQMPVISLGVKFYFACADQTHPYVCPPIQGRSSGLIGEV